jgi:hypothetical protein
MSFDHHQVLNKLSNMSLITTKAFVEVRPLRLTGIACYTLSTSNELTKRSSVFIENQEIPSNFGKMRFSYVFKNPAKDLCPGAHKSTPYDHNSLRSIRFFPTSAPRFSTLSLSFVFSYEILV